MDTLKPLPEISACPLLLSMEPHIRFCGLPASHSTENANRVAGGVLARLCGHLREMVGLSIRARFPTWTAQQTHIGCFTSTRLFEYCPASVVRSPRGIRARNAIRSRRRFRRFVNASQTTTALQPSAVAGRKYKANSKEMALPLSQSYLRGGIPLTGPPLHAPGVRPRHGSTD